MMDQEIGIIKDLGKKAVSDAMRHTETACDLACDVAGKAGLFIIAQKLAMNFTIGAAMTLHSMRSGEIEKRPRDDVLCVALLNAALEHDVQQGEAIDLAQEWFAKIKGVRHDLPKTWRA